MIRELREEEIDRVMEIWLNGNTEAHSFIPKDFWRDHFQEVKEMLPEAEVYVCGTDQEIQGFIGLDGDYIAGIFVAASARSKGIGAQLLNYVKNRRKQLVLGVYRKNQRAVRFYEREGFVIRSENTDEATGEKEYLMAWEERER